MTSDLSHFDLPPQKQLPELEEDVVSCWLRKDIRNLFFRVAVNYLDEAILV